MKIFKYLKINMTNSVFHLDFQGPDMDYVDVVLGYSWMELFGIVKINVKNKFLKYWN